MTITGSIGVFATFPMSKILVNLSGSMLRMWRPTTMRWDIVFFKRPRAILGPRLKRGIEHVYDTFKARVARGET